jgi:hypothetical protein
MKALEKEVGKVLLVRTVTNYFVGRLVKVHDDALELVDVSWIPEMGRFHRCWKDGMKEVEPFPDGQTVYIASGALVDVTEYPRLLREPQ